MDNKGWVTEDGKVYTTSHGGLYEMSIRELKDTISDTKKSLDSLEKARELEKNARLLTGDPLDF